VYIFNRDASANLTISSPLEAHKANTIHFSIVAVDVGFDNPVFACIELDYTEADSDPTVMHTLTLTLTLTLTHTHTHAHTHAHARTHTHTMYT
jgi:splicing factor 3B subunit 3